MPSILLWPLIWRRFCLCRSCKSEAYYTVAHRFQETLTSFSHAMTLWRHYKTVYLKHGYIINHLPPSPPVLSRSSPHPYYFFTSICECQSLCRLSPVASNTSHKHSSVYTMPIKYKSPLSYIPSSRPIFPLVPSWKIPWSPSGLFNWPSQYHS